MLPVVASRTRLTVWVLGSWRARARIRGRRWPVHRRARADVPAAPGAPDHLTAKIAELDALIAAAAAPFEAIIARLQTIRGPGGAPPR